MNTKETKYLQYALPKEMLETPGVLRSFDLAQAADWARPAADAFRKGTFERVLLTGEGSSRLFPAKHAMYENNRAGRYLPLATDGSTQCLEYDLSKTLVLGASNSGKTKELIRLFSAQKQRGHQYLFGLTATPGSLLETYANRTFVLGCGKEDAVAATKSVMEQALAVQVFLAQLAGEPLESLSSDLGQAADAVQKTLEAAVDPEITAALAASTMIYFAGRNTGVAEELALKTNEITRKKSAYLEGTIAVHGIEEVMEPNEAVVIVEPFEDEEEKFEACLSKGVGMHVIAIATRPTRFPTLIVPGAGRFQQYVELAAGWNLLVEAGLAEKIDLDTPRRARKIGNEFTG